MTTEDWTGLILSAIGGGLIGWCVNRAHDAWRRRPIVVWDHDQQRWRSALIVMEERRHAPVRAD